MSKLDDNRREVNISQEIGVGYFKVYGNIRVLGGSDRFNRCEWWHEKSERV